MIKILNTRERKNIKQTQSPNRSPGKKTWIKLQAAIRHCGVKLFITQYWHAVQQQAAY